MMFIRFILIIGLVASSVMASEAQVSKGGKPVSFKRGLDLVIPVIEMPVFSLEKARLHEKSLKNNAKTWVFAYPFHVDICPENDGAWTTLKSGEKIWSVGIASGGAYSLNFIFNCFHLNKGVELFIYNEEKSVILGAFTESNNAVDSVFPVSPVPGEKIIVEMNMKKDVKSYGCLKIGQVSHDYKDFFKQAEGLSGSCNINASCPEGNGWGVEKRSICRILIDGHTICTGTLMNNTAYNAKPYVLTANHCISSSSKANNSIFYFNYISNKCSSDNGSLENSISGSVLKATSYKLDFSLVELNKYVPRDFNPYFSGWNADTLPPQSSITLHHPQGDVMKVSGDQDPATKSDYPYDITLQKNSFWKISDWEFGTTEGGSSGGPLFDQNHRVVGDLTGGDADCFTPVNDYYAMFSNAFSKFSFQPDLHLKPWLDPVGYGVKVMDGFDPYKEVASNCFTLSNIEPSEQIKILNHEGSWGYWTGHNSDSITKFAERFVDTINDTINGIYFNVADLNYTSDSSGIKVKIWFGNDEPVIEHFSTTIPLNTFVPGGRTYVDFGNIYLYKDTFFVSYEIAYDSTDMFALNHSGDRGVGGFNSFYLFKDTAWLPLNQVSSDGLAFSANIEVVSCGVILGVKEKKHLMNEELFTAYPNPVTSQLNIDLTKSIPDELTIRIVSITGNVVKMQQYPQNQRKIVIEMDHLPPGTYIVNLVSTDGMYSRLITKF